MRRRDIWITFSASQFHLAPTRTEALPGTRCSKSRSAIFPPERGVNGGEILSLPQISRSSWSHIGHSLLHHWQTFGSLWLGELLVCCLRISNASFTFMFVSWSSFWYSPFSSTTKMANSMKSIVLILKDEWKLTSSWLNRVHLSKPFSLSHGGCMSSVNPHLQKRAK